MSPCPRVLSLALLALCSGFSSADRTQFNDGPLLVGPSQPVVASPGADAVLPCRLQPAFDVVSLTLEWSMADLKPDPADPLSRVGYVHLYRGGSEVPDMKIQAFAGRTELLADALKDGDVSLRIKRVTAADQGRYRCHIPKLPGPLKELVVELLVEQDDDDETKIHLDPQSLPNPDEEADTGGRLYLGTLISGAFCVLLVLLVLGVLLVPGVLGGAVTCSLKRLRDNRPECDGAATDPLEVGENHP
uniref:myelin-oligodendrocyte glycoprotein-like isoform X2 n=1 Tax=Gasterosteus aculeatus aculeatus TaxID=481459 RepID=UPI001A998C68|nr:myelin-oligodendrocyte glycoprotein-like isoform X2 [Gasterosteus aculeatus aculeatus]